MRAAFLVLFPILALSFGAVAGCGDDPEPASPAADAGSDGATESTDAGVDAGDFGEPIDAPSNEWTWVPFDDSSCADGSPTGIGVNPGSSKRLLVFFEGGGACWNEGTCYVFGTASNIKDGFGRAKFDSQVKSASAAATVFDRTGSDNPFKDYSFVYVPYCTGDVHAGDREQQYGDKTTRHVGRRNVSAYLKRIVPTFRDSERIVVSGSSAGGFGALVNFWRFKEAFANAQVDLLNDCAPPFPQSKVATFGDWDEAWDLFGAVPAGCEACKDDVGSAFSYYATAYPTSKLALLAFDNDPTISRFYNMEPTAFAAELEALGKRFDAHPNAHYFFVADEAHTMLRKLSVTSGGKTLGAWIGEMVTDAPGWASVDP
jgi:hypothetical protein